MDGGFFPFGNSGQRPSPLVQALWLVLAVAALVGLVLIGTIVLLAVVGLAAIAFLGLKLRAWWLRRGPPGGGRGPGRPAKGVRYIEGQYEVIDSDAARRRSGERR
jgi:hypothetical protein